MEFLAVARLTVSEDVFSVARKAHVADWTNVAQGALLITRRFGSIGCLGGGQLGAGCDVVREWELVTARDCYSALHVQACALLPSSI